MEGFNQIYVKESYVCKKKIIYAFLVGYLDMLQMPPRLDNALYMCLL